MIAYTPQATRQVADLRRHYEDLERINAIEALDAALHAAEQRIANNPLLGLTAPRPYPHVACPGRLWTKAGRYWIAYNPMQPPIIVGVFYETADIPRRL